MSVDIDTPADAARYNTKYRNRALAYLSAERLYMLYTSGGLEAVRGQLAKIGRSRVEDELAWAYQERTYVGVYDRLSRRRRHPLSDPGTMPGAGD